MKSDVKTQVAERLDIDNQNILLNVSDKLPDTSLKDHRS